MKPFCLKPFMVTIRSGSKSLPAVVLSGLWLLNGGLMDIPLIRSHFHLPLTEARAEDEAAIVAEDPKLGRPVEFERDVYLILEANCIACHNAAVSENDLILENSGAIMKGGSAGPAVVAGKPDESLLFTVAARTAEPVMPPLPNDVKALKLTPQQLGVLRQWILEGAAGGGAGRSMAMKWQPINSQLKAVYSVDIDPWGRFIAASRGGRVSIYDMAARDHVSELNDAALQSSEPVFPAPVAHRDYVHAAAFHPSGDMLATSGYREVKLWKRSVDTLTSAIALPADTQAWATSDDGSQLAVSTAAPGIVLMNSRTGETRLQIDTMGQPVTALRITGGEKPLVIAALADLRLQTALLTSGEILHRSEPMATATMAFSQLLADQRMAGLSADGVVRLLTVAADTGVIAVASEIKSESGPVQKISGSGAAIVTVAADRKVEFWKSADGAKIGASDLPAHCVSVSVNQAGDRCLVTLEDGQSLLWSPAENKQLALLNTDLHGLRKVKHAEYQKSILDSRVVVVKGQVDETEKELTAQKDAETKAKEEHDKSIAAAADTKTKLDAAVAANTVAKTALAASPEDAALKTAAEASEKAEVAAKEANTAADAKQQLAKKSLDFATAAVGRADTRVNERKQQHQQATQEAEAGTAALEAAKTASAAQPVTGKFCSFTAGGTIAVTADATGTVRLWNSTDGTPLDVLTPAQGQPAGDLQGLFCAGNTTLTPLSGSQLMTRSAFGEWKLAGTLGPKPPEPGKQLSADNADSVFVDRVLSLAFSPDGVLLAAGGGEASRAGQVTLWNVAEQSLVKEFADAHSDTVYGLEFSPDGRLLASASADKFAKVFNVETGKHVQSYEGHTHHVMDITWKADRTLLASAGADNAIKVWNVETGEQARTISTYSKQVTSLNFVGLQDNILSSSGDKRVFLHSAGNGNPVREFAGSPDYVYRAASSVDGAIIAAGCEDGILRVWNGTDGKELVSFKP